MKIFGRRRKKRRRGPRSLPRVLSKSEARRLLDAAEHNPAHQAIIAVGLYAGLRRFEICNLQVADVDLDHREIRVRKGKGGKDAVVPLNPRLFPYIQLFLDGRDPDAPLIPTRDGGRFSGSGIRDAVCRTAKRAGLDGVHAHTLRHTFGTEAQRQGKDLARTQRLLRHVDVQSTQIYVHLVTDDIRDVSDAIDFE